MEGIGIGSRTLTLMSGMSAYEHKATPLYSFSTQSFKVEDGQRDQVKRGHKGPSQLIKAIE